VNNHAKLIQAKEHMLYPDPPLEFVFGGTFDPIHNGHLAIIKALYQLQPQLNIRLLPCSVPALKKRPSTTFNQRLEMLNLAIESLPADVIKRLSIDCREQQRQGPSYMVQSLASLNKAMPEKSFVLVMGADSALDLSRWHQSELLAKQCHLLVLNRCAIEKNRLEKAITKVGFNFINRFSEFNKQANGAVYCHKMTEMSESSTQIRQNRHNILELDSMLPQSVIKYIVQQHLYQ
jgi:nicotinate-nucleotide adenylyltransferase